jgi:hypothetical protein
MADPAAKPDLSGIKDAQLRRAVEGLGAAIDATPNKHAATPKLPIPAAPAAAKVIQLPLWPEPVRGAPNSFLRSALFAAIQGKTRRYMEKALLASIQGVAVRYTGKQLDQSDLDVWEQAVHLARQHPLGNVCHVTIYAFLKALGRSTGKSDYQWLDDVITRLVACEVRLRTKDKEYGGNLIADWKRDDALGSYKITLNPHLVKLYGWNDWTAVDWEQRQKLRGKPLALWLHGFYSSHAKPFPMRMATIQQLTGSATKNPRHFKANLKAALGELEAATGIQGTIDGDLVTVERNGQN